jgi:hypothetical protein
VRGIRVRWRKAGEGWRRTFLTDELTLGSAPNCDVQIGCAQVRPIHARLCVCQNGLLLIPEARAPIRYREGPVHAPVVLDSEPFRLGDWSLVAQIDPATQSLSAFKQPGMRCLGERDHPGTGVRRFIVDEGEQEEWVVPTDGWSESEHRLWEERVAFGAKGTGACKTVTVNGRTAVVENAGREITGLRVLEALSRGRVRPSPEFWPVLMVKLLEAAAHQGSVFGVHGALDPRHLRFHPSGSVRFSWPGPRYEVWNDPSILRFASAAVRVGKSPEWQDDLHAIEALANAFFEAVPGEGDDYQTFTDGLLRRNLPHEDLLSVAESVRRFANNEGIDPTEGHLGRVVRAVQACRLRPMVRIASPFVDF